jgi:hypothetical protein
MRKLICTSTVFCVLCATLWGLWLVACIQVPERLDWESHYVWWTDLPSGTEPLGILVAAWVWPTCGISTVIYGFIRVSSKICDKLNAFAANRKSPRNGGPSGSELR